MIMGELVIRYKSTKKYDFLGNTAIEKRFKTNGIYFILIPPFLFLIFFTKVEGMKKINISDYCGRIMWLL